MKIEKCPVCGINRIDGVFRWSYSGKAAPKGQVYGRVCQYAKKPGCINPCTDGKDDRADFSTEMKAQVSSAMADLREQAKQLKKVDDFAVSEMTTRVEFRLNNPSPIDFEAMARDVLASPEVQKALTDYENTDIIEE